MNVYSLVMALILSLMSFDTQAQPTFLVSNTGQILGLVQTQTPAIDYYTAAYGPDKAGKVARLGTLAVEYYTAAYGPDKQGRVAQIGDISIDYYTAAYGPDKQGKVSTIGDTTVDYYTAAYGPQKQGKIKEVHTGRAGVQIVVSLWPTQQQP